jgi:hypothetical protein
MKMYYEYHLLYRKEIQTKKIKVIKCCVHIERNGNTICEVTKEGVIRKKSREKRRGKILKDQKPSISANQRRGLDTCIHKR